MAITPSNNTTFPNMTVGVLIIPIVITIQSPVTIIGSCGTPWNVLESPPQFPPVTLPDGLIFTPSLPITGSTDDPLIITISGTPTTATVPGNPHITVIQVQGVNRTPIIPRVETLDLRYFFNIDAPLCPTIIISPTTLPNGTVGNPYSVPFSALPPPVGTYSWSAANLPPFLSLSPTGLLSNFLPVIAGTYTGILIQVNDSGLPNCPAGQLLNLTLHICDLLLSPATLPNGQVGVPYDQTITASNGTNPQYPPYSFIYPAIPPPNGLTATYIAPDKLRIFGTPTTVGTTPLHIEANDSEQPPCTGFQDYRITITAPPKKKNKKRVAGVICVKDIDGEFVNYRGTTYQRLRESECIFFPTRRR